MEMVIEVVGTEESKTEDSVVGIANSNKDIAPDPVVYKLVRVDGDGRLVPATDDEVIVVEDLLEVDKTKQLKIDTCHTVECDVKENCASEETLPDSLKGTLESDNIVAVTATSNVPHESVEEKEKENTQEEKTDQPESSKDCSNHSDGLSEKKSENSANWKPDFSKLEGEICLDNLTVKELQETFKATFGRETSVKDKQWLKRRIVMGLTNSCNFSATSFLIKDGKVVKKGKEISKFMDNHVTEKTSGSSDQYVIQKVFNSPTQCEDLNTEQRANKRMRKPTKRYIEELSQVESNEKLVSSNKSVGNLQNVQSSNKTLVMRQVSFGGAGVQVPYVSRIRRGRPRENFMSLMNSGADMANIQLKKEFVINTPRPDEIEQPVITTREKDRRIMEMENDTQNMECFTESSDDNAVKMRSVTQNGIRRKHHRPWTIEEVVKLVDGVAKYGAGRWSEIKRFAFASSSFRTSVDLKDKWRNLLRASFAQLPVEEGMQNLRKHSSVPIPTPILIRVRELAELQEQVMPVIKYGGGHSSSGNVGISVNDKTLGYL